MYNLAYLRCFLLMLVGLFTTANMALAQDGTRHIVTLNSNSGTVTPETIECSNIKTRACQGTPSFFVIDSFSRI